MRFYSKVTVAICLNAVTAAVWMILGLGARHRGGLLKLNGILFLFLFLISVLTQLLTYWELHPDGLYERRLWRKRIVPFDQIAAVKCEGPGGKPALNWLTVIYKSPFPSFDTDQNATHRGILILAPAHRGELLTALRHAAPQASFETL